MNYTIDYQLKSELEKDIEDYYLFPVVEGNSGVVVAEFLYEKDAREYCNFKNSQRLENFSVLGPK